MPAQPTWDQGAMEALKAKIENFLSECVRCGYCQSKCSFLEKYGLPPDIIEDEPESVFLCTNCGACSKVCPKELKPSEALFALKYELISNGKLSEKTKRAIESSRRYALRGHRFPFVHYPYTEIAFWPGCSLQGTRPDIVKKIPEMLKETYGKVGIVLDCCFDPAFQNGDLDIVEKAATKIKERLKTHGIKKLILGCSNCLKIFKLYMPEIEVDHILNVLPDGQKNFSLSHKEVYLHHPCPSFRFEELQERVFKIASIHFSIAKQNTIPMCCGLGGLSHNLNEELSEKFTERHTCAGDPQTIITYCMGCKNRFLKMGKEAYHLIEILTDAKQMKKPLGSKKKWLNRLILSTSLKLKSKRVVVAILLTLSILFATLLRSKGYFTIENIFELIRAHPILAPLLFIILYSIGPSLFIPSLPLTIGAGFLWGPFWGVVFSITGATIGATVSFLLSRYIFGDTIKARFGYPRWQWLKEKVEKHGWKAVAFARLLPILPFPVLNYLFGITPLPLKHYIWTTFVFMLPACIAYVVFGSSMSELIIKGNINALIVGILAVSIMMLLPFIFKRFLRRFYGEKS